LSIVVTNLPVLVFLANDLFKRFEATDVSCAFSIAKGGLDFPPAWRVGRLPHAKTVLLLSFKVTTDCWFVFVATPFDQCCARNVAERR
jgi:hypothetical protein